MAGFQVRQFAYLGTANAFLIYAFFPTIERVISNEHIDGTTHAQLQEESGSGLKFWMNDNALELPIPNPHSANGSKFWTGFGTSAIVVAVMVELKSPRICRDQ